MNKNSFKITAFNNAIFQSLSLVVNTPVILQT